MNKQGILFVILIVEFVLTINNPWPTSGHDSQCSNRASFSNFTGYFELLPLPGYETTGYVPFMVSSEHLLLVEPGNSMSAGLASIKLLNTTSLQVTSSWNFVNGNMYNQLFSLGSNIDGTRFYTYYQEYHNITLYCMSPTGTIIWSQAMPNQMNRAYFLYGLKNDEIHYVYDTYTKWQGSTGAIVLNTQIPSIPTNFILLDEISGITIILGVPAQNAPEKFRPYLIALSSTTAAVLWEYNFSQFVIESNVYYSIDAGGVISDAGIIILSVTLTGVDVQSLRIAISGSGVKLWSDYQTFAKNSGHYVENFALFSHDANLLAVASANVISLITIDSNTLLQNMTVDQLDQYSLRTIGETILFFAGHGGDNEYKLLYLVNSNSSFSDPTFPLTLRGNIVDPILSLTSLFVARYDYYGPTTILKLERSDCTPFPVPSTNTSQIFIPANSTNYSIGAQFFGIIAFIFLVVILVVMILCWARACCLLSKNKRECIIANILCLTINASLCIGIIISFLVIPVVLLTEPFDVSISGVNSDTSYNVGDQISITVNVNNENSLFGVDCFLNGNGNLQLFPSDNTIIYTVPSSQNQINLGVTCQYSYIMWFIQDFLLAIPTLICEIISDGACDGEEQISTSLNSYLFQSETIPISEEVPYTYSNNTGMAELTLNAQIESINFGSVLVNSEFLLVVLDILCINKTTTRVTVDQGSIVQAFHELHAVNASIILLKRSVEDVNIEFGDLSFSVPIDYSSSATFGWNETLSCIPSFEFHVYNGVSTDLKMGVACEFSFSVSASVEIHSTIKTKVKQELGEISVPFTLPFLGPLLSKGILQISIEVEIEIEAGVEFSIETGTSFSGTGVVSIQLPSPGFNEDFNIGPMKTYFNPSADLCDVKIDIALNWLKFAFYPLGKNEIFSPDVSVTLGRHLWFDALTPYLGEPIHDIHFESCPCPDDQLCPSLIAASQGATLSFAMEQKFFALSLEIKKDYFFDQSIFDQVCSLQSCSPLFLCDTTTIPPLCKPTYQSDALFYSQCNETCVMRYSCDKTTYKCAEDVNGAYATPYDCQKNCIAPPWFGCPCKTNTPCCACPQAPFPCSGSCAFHNECYPPGKDCCLGF